MTTALLGPLGVAYIVFLVAALVIISMLPRHASRHDRSTESDEPFPTNSSATIQRELRFSGIGASVWTARRRDWFTSCSAEYAAKFKEVANKIRL